MYSIIQTVLRNYILALLMFAAGKHWLPVDLATNDAAAEMLNLMFLFCAPLVAVAWSWWQKEQALLKAKAAALDEETKKIESGGRVAALLLCIALTSAGLVGCSHITPNTAALPANATQAQKDAAYQADLQRLKDEAVAKLKDPVFQSQAKSVLTIAGKMSLAHAVDGPDREAIAKELYSWGDLFNSLSTGKSVSIQDVAAAAADFQVKIDTSKNADFSASFDGLWLVLYPLLNDSKDPQLYITWLQILSGAARDAGLTYYTPES